MIRFIGDKTKLVSGKRISRILDSCIQRNQFANGGPCVMQLEQTVRRLFRIFQGKAVIAASSGTAALHALVGGLCCHYGEIRFAAQAFTFPCHKQQLLRNTAIVDIDESGSLDLNRVPPDIDGIIVTNCFGHLGDIEAYEKWRNKKGKLLVFDNAATPATLFNGCNSLNFGHGAIVSFHHTKPLGFGEGGMIVVDRKYEAAVRMCIGYKVNGSDIPGSEYGSNFKMSDLAAAYILAMLENFDKIRQHHSELYSYFKRELKKLQGVRLFPCTVENPFASCLAILFDHPFDIGFFTENGITAHKYYRPLRSLPVSVDYYNRIACLPLHSDINTGHLDHYIEIISSFCRW